MAGTVLVNYWYAHPVGHAIEALRYCLGYKAADPELRLGLLLNDAMPLELVACCPLVDELYPVRYRTFDEPDSDPRAALAGLPRDWDWVVDNHREREGPTTRTAASAPSSTPRTSTSGRGSPTPGPAASRPPTSPTSSSGSTCRPRRGRVRERSRTAARRSRSCSRATRGCGASIRRLLPGG